MKANPARNGVSKARIWRRTLFLLPALLLGTLSFGQTATQNESSPTASSDELLEQHLGKGYEALKQEKYGDAAEEFRAALGIDPTLVMRARFPLAIALFEEHQTAEARRELETVRKAVGDQPGVLYYLGRLDLDEHDYKKAITNLNKASAKPPYPDTAYYLGLGYARDGNTQDAEKWLKEAVRLHPDDSRAQYQLGLLYRKEGREEEANQAFQKSKEQKAQSDKLSQLKYECGQELDRGVSEKAITVCDQLYDPNNADKLTALGILYGQHGELERAQKPLARAAELQPQSPQAQYNLAFTYYQLKRYAHARGPLAGAVERWPDLFPLNALYGAVLWNLGEARAAYEALHRAHRLNAEDAGTTDMLYVTTLELAKQSADSHADAEELRYLQEAASLKPGDPEPHERLVGLYTRTGRPEQAADERKKAEQLAKAPKN
jgi:Flp pilus assembly protein TadD